jgi:hypothetical protein
MRSIRRSLLGYLFLLLAVALGAVGTLVDRFAIGAIRTREASEADRIEQAFELRKHEAKTKFDADLLAETKALAKEVQFKTATLLGQNIEPRRGGGATGGGATGAPAGPRPLSHRLRHRMRTLGSIACGRASWNSRRLRSRCPLRSVSRPQSMVGVPSLPPG